MQALTLPRPTAVASRVVWAIAGLGCAAASVVGGAAFAIVAALAIAAVAAGVDAREGRLPDPIVAAAAAPIAIAGVALVATGQGAATWALAVGALLLAGPLLVIHLVAPGSLGFGDVKLGTVLGAACALVAPVVALAALCVASGAMAVFGLTTRRREVPLGPGLVAGAATAIGVATAFGAEVVTWR